MEGQAPQPRRAPSLRASGDPLCARGGRARLSRLHARARAAHPPASARRSRPLLPSHRAGSARRARGWGPGVQRGPRWGPAPRLGRMRPGAARELSRAPVPAPGLRIRNRRPAPERHDFQAAFRLDSLQVRGRRFPPSLQLGGAAHHPSKGRVCAQMAWGRVEGVRPRAGWGHRLGPGAPIPSPSSPKHRGRGVGGTGPSYPNFGGPDGLNLPTLRHFLPARVAGRGQCPGPAWAFLGLAASCCHLGRERTLL